MSSALLNKYLQAARDVADHMVLKPDGFDFAPHHMLVETDRDRYSIKRILDFYARQPTDYAAYFDAAWRFKHRRTLGKPNATLASIAAEAKVSAKYLPMVWQILEEAPETAKQEVGPVAKLQAMWRALPGPADDKPDVVRAKCVEMRDFVVKIRNHTAMQFYSPLVRGLPAGSQPLLNWKLRNFDLHRRESDPKALLNDNEPPPAVPDIPKYPGLHQEGGPRWAALMAKGPRRRSRSGGSRRRAPRYEASFSKLGFRLPGQFLRLRARPVLPGRFGGQGTFSERRLSQRDGVLARRYPAFRIDPRRQGTEGVGPALGRVRLHRRSHRPNLDPVLLQSERRGGRQRRRVRLAASSR